MGSWSTYVENMMSAGDSKDCAIVGISPISIWASHPNGNMSGITPQQIDAILCVDRGALQRNGVLLGKKKYTVIQDHLSDDGMMVIKGKSDSEDQRCNVVIGKCETVIIFLEGNLPHVKSTLNTSVKKMIEYLKECKM